jgi:hypothetical protein
LKRVQFDAEAQRRRENAEKSGHSVGAILLCASLRLCVEEAFSNNFQAARRPRRKVTKDALVGVL